MVQQPIKNNHGLSFSQVFSLCIVFLHTKNKIIFSIPSCTMLFILILIPHSFICYYNNFINLIFYIIILVYKISHKFISHSFTVGHSNWMINRSMGASSQEDIKYFHLFIQFQLIFEMADYVETCLDFSLSTCLKLNSSSSSSRKKINPCFYYISSLARLRAPCFPGWPGLEGQVS